MVLANLTGGDRVTTGRQVPFCLFTDPELARVGLSEREARERGVGYRLAKIPMEAVLRARTLSETRGFLKALIEEEGDRILGFTAFGAEAGEVMAVVQVAMLAGLPYTALRDAVLTHPTMAEGLATLFRRCPPGPDAIWTDNRCRTDNRRGSPWGIAPPRLPTDPDVLVKSAARGGGD